MARIVFDCDGVVADFDSCAISHFGECDQTLYSLKERWPGRETEIDAFLIDPCVYLSLEPIAGIHAELARLHQEGHELILVTGRGITMVVCTLYWLKQHNLRDFFSEVHCVNWDMKADVIATLQPHMAIDDSPYQVEQLRARGIDTAVFDAPYNRRLTGHRLLGWGKNKK